MTTEQQTVAEIIQDIQESRRYPSLHALINAGMTSARVHYKSAAGALDEDELLEAQEAGFDAAEDIRSQEDQDLEASRNSPA